MWRSCFTRLSPFVALLTLFAGRVSAHPSSGIVVDEKGNVFVADINSGVWKIDTEGKLTHIHKEAGHWLALDAEGSFARVDFTKSDHWPRWFKRRTPDGAPAGSGWPGAWPSCAPASGEKLLDMGLGRCGSLPPHAH